MLQTQTILLDVTKEQEKYLDHQSLLLNKFYNYLLKLYKSKKITLYDLSSEKSSYSLIRECRERLIELNEFSIYSLKDVVERLKKSILNKAKTNEFPKEKKNDIKWFSIFYANNEKNIILFKKHIILFNNIGEEIKIKLKSGIRKNNKIYNFRIIKKYNKYALLIILDVDTEIPYRKINNAVAIDLNHKNFLMCADSNGNTFEVQNIPMVKYFFKKIDEIRSLLSKTKKDSKRYKYLSNAMHRLCYKREEQIKKALYNLAHYLTDKYDYIGIGNYRPSLKNTFNKNMRRVMMNESLICKFRDILKKVSEKNGVLFREINEYGTTKKCFSCGYEETKDPSIRMYVCPQCGRTYNRDINSAINIGQKAKMLSIQDYVGKDLTRPTYTVSSDYKLNDLIVKLNR